jgi:hypothetical protein
MPGAALQGRGLELLGQRPPLRRRGRAVLPRPAATAVQHGADAVLAHFGRRDGADLGLRHLPDLLAQRQRLQPRLYPGFQRRVTRGLACRPGLHDGVRVAGTGGLVPQQDAGEQQGAKRRRCARHRLGSIRGATVVAEAKKRQPLGRRD